MIRGTEQGLQLTSDPPGARAVLESRQFCTTAYELHVSQSTSTVVTFEKEGCEREMISVFPTLAGAGVVLVGVIDCGAGEVCNLYPDPVVAHLRGNVGAPTPSVTNGSPIGTS